MQDEANLFESLQAAQQRVRDLQAMVLVEDARDPRLAPIIEKVRGVFGREAAPWWTSPAMALDWVAPREVALRGEAGRSRVEALIAQIDFGVGI